MGRVYSHEELELFERSHRVLLPAAYRAHLLTVGCAGGKLSLLEDWCQPHCEDSRIGDDFLARPFPHREAWNDLSLLGDDALGWSAPYFDVRLWCGALRIANMGCEAYRMLVVSGPERGHIWCDDRCSTNGGIFPLTRWGRRVTVESYLGWSWF